MPRRQLIETAIQSLGLRDLAPFDPAEKIIEYQAGLIDGPLVRMTNREFVDELSTDCPAPGGGSVAALCAAQAAGLVAMVANLTVGKKKYEAVQDRVKEIAERGQDLKDFFLAAIDDDTDAFNAVMDCFGLPKAHRRADSRPATWPSPRPPASATRVPLSVLAAVPALLELAAEIGRDRQRQQPQRRRRGRADGHGRRRGRLLQRADQPGSLQGPGPERGARISAAATRRRATRGPGPLRGTGRRDAARPIRGTAGIGAGLLTGGVA